MMFLEKRFGPLLFLASAPSPLLGRRQSIDEVSEELNRHNGNVWTVILSLRREDAERLGFGEGKRWRDMLRSETQELSKNFKIPMENLKWYAAFHNESHR